MRILVVNASPKGEYSITLQTLRYLEKSYPAHSFEYLAAGQKIKALEKDFSGALDMLSKAELILFSYPVYTFIAPSQLHRFFELMKAHNAPVEGKFVSQITTSKHFYDVTAHRYVNENCMDLGMKVIKGLSEDMDDLLTEKGRREAKSFFEYVLFSAENGIFEKAVPRYVHVPVIASEANECAHTQEKDVVIVTDANRNDMPTYQRLIKKSRLKQIETFINNGGFSYIWFSYHCNSWTVIFFCHLIFRRKMAGNFIQQISKA